MDSGPDTQPCTYDKLPPRSIRLTKILEHTPHELSKLVCSFEVVSIDDDAIDFAALSYTWGPPINTTACAREYGAESDVMISVRHSPSSVRTETNGNNGCSSDSDTVEETANIGRNLHEALDQLWRLGTRHSWWIDALCINQQDMDERNHQLLLMGDIYARANFVIAWLGKAFVPEEHIRYIHQTVDEAMLAYIGRNHEVIDPTKVIWSGGGLSIEPIGLIVPHDMVASLYLFYACVRWFSRAWIVQEIAVARKRTIAVFGSLCINKDALFRIALLLHDVPYFVKCAENELTASCRMMNTITFPSTGQIRGLHALSTHSRHEGPESASLRDLLTKGYGATCEDTRRYAYLEWLLTQTLQRQASDSRDRIYSLLGLANVDLPESIEPSVIPDYNTPPARMHTNFAKQCLRNLPHLSLLSLVGNPISRHPRGSLSWVLMFHGDMPSSSLRHLNWHNSGTRCFNASLACDHQKPSLHYLETKLMLQARYCDRISACSTTNSEITVTKPKLETVNQVGRLAFLLDSCCRLHPAYSNGVLGNGRVGAVMKLMTFATWRDDNDANFAQKFRAFVTRYLAWESKSAEQPDDVACAEQSIRDSIKRLDDEKSLPTEAEIDYISTCYDEWHRGVISGGVTSIDEQFRKVFAESVAFSSESSRTVGGRKYVVTANGLLGLCSAWTEVGDEVWLLSGAKVPFALRPTAEAGHYVLQGECYIQGGTYGELISSGFAGPEREVILV